MSKHGALALSERYAQRWGSLWTIFYRFGPPRWSTWLREHAWGRRLVIGTPMTWLTLFFLIPFIIVLKIAFSEVRIAMPPYAPLWEWASDTMLQINVNLANFRFLFTESLYASTYLYSLKVAAISTLLCLLIGYPMAYVIARLPRHALLVDLAAPPGGIDRDAAAQQGIKFVWARGMGMRAPITVGRSQWSGIRPRIEAILSERK